MVSGGRSVHPTALMYTGVELRQMLFGFEAITTV